MNVGASPEAASEGGVSCHRDGGTLVLVHMGEPYVAFPDRCVVCNTPVRRAFLEHNQKSVFRETFYLQKTIAWLPGIRFYEERSIDVEYTMCDAHRLRRGLRFLWYLAAVAVFVAPVVIVNLRLLEGTALWVFWAACWIAAAFLFWKGARASTVIALVQIGPTIARFQVGRPFLESFPSKASP